jgi:UDP-glucose 4-epimerase
VRDYVDVRDIAAAHLVAANATKPIPAIINIGTGRGASVREIVKLVLEAINKSDAQVIEAPRRAGDPAFLCANVDLAATELGFKSKYSLEESIRSLF